MMDWPGWQARPKWKRVLLVSTRVYTKWQLRIEYNNTTSDDSGGKQMDDISSVRLYKYIYWHSSTHTQSTVGAADDDATWSLCVDITRICKIRLQPNQTYGKLDSVADWLRCASLVSPTAWLIDARIHGANAIRWPNFFVWWHNDRCCQRAPRWLIDQITRAKRDSEKRTSSGHLFGVCRVYSKLMVRCINSGRLTPASVPYSHYDALLWIQSVGSIDLS